MRVLLGVEAVLDAVVHQGDEAGSYDDTVCLLEESLGQLV
jgi:hypothetical protein